MGFTLHNAHGDSEAYGYWLNAFFNDANDTGACGRLDGFRLTHWDFPQGVGIGLVYGDKYRYRGPGPATMERLVEVNNTLGWTVDFAWGGGGDPTHLASFTDGSRTVTLDWSGSTNDLAAGHVDPQGRHTNFAYRLQQSRSPAQRPLPYNLLERVLTADNLAEANVAYTYDGVNRVQQIQDAVAIQQGGRGPYTFYLADGTRGERDDPLGQPYSVVYDTFGHASRYSDELGLTTKVVSDGRGRTLSTTYPAGDCEVFAYDESNNTTDLWKVDTASSCNTGAGSTHVLHASATWNGTWNKPATVTNPRGKTTTLEYYPSGTGASLLKTATRPTIPEGVPVYDFTYTALGQLATATGPTGIVTRNTYDLAANHYNLLSTIADDGGRHLPDRRAEQGARLCVGRRPGHARRPESNAVKSAPPFHHRPRCVRVAAGALPGKRRTAMRKTVLTLALAGALLPLLAAASGSVVTYHNSNQRDGAYVVPKLTLAAAANVTRDTRFNATVSGKVYAQPLFWKPKGAGAGLVIVATESNNVYALNANTGAVVWQRLIGNSMPLGQLPCGNIDPMGITGTPVIEPGAARVYFNAMTKTGDGARHMLYALSLSDGAIVNGYPLDMQALMTAKGASFASNVHGARGALLFFKDKLYVSYGGHFGDCGNYRGTVAQVNPGTKTVDAVWQTRATGGGIWAQGGIAGDGAFLFATTGNTFTGSTWMDGEAIVRLSPDLAHSDDTSDFFAPSNWKALDNADQDLGGTEALPIDIKGARKVKRVIAFGKDGKAYLANRGNLGGIGGEIQNLQVANGGIRTAPAVYETADSTMVAFTSSGSSHCSGSNITMLDVAAGGATPMSFAWCAQFSGGGAPIVTTSDGTADAIVWVVGAEGDGLLHGFNAKTGAVAFAGTGTNMTGLHHFQTLIATQRRLYVAGDNKVYAFKF